MSMPHHCTISKNGLKMYFVGPRRVSRERFFQEFPDFNDELCVTSDKRRKIRASLKILKSIEKDLGQDGPLSTCEKKLKECNQKVVDLESKLLSQANELKNKISSLTRAGNNKKECLDKISNLEKEISSLRDELSKCMSEREKYQEELRVSEQLQTRKAEDHGRLLSELKESRDNYESEVRRAIELKNNIESLNDELDELKRRGQDQSKIKECEDKLLRAEDALEQLSTRNNDLSQQLLEIKMRNTEFKQELSKLIIEKQNVDLENDKYLVTEITRQINELSEKVAVSESQIDLLNQNIAKKNDELEQLRSLKSDGLTDKVLLERISELEMQLGRRSEDMSSLSTKFQLLEQEKQKLLEENSRLLEERASLSEASNSQLKKHEQEVDEFNERLKKFEDDQKEFEFLKVQNKKLYDAVLSVLKYGESEILSVDEIVNRLQQYDKENSELLEQNRRILEKEGELLSRLDNLRAENERLKSNVQRLPADKAVPLYEKQMEELRRGLENVVKNKEELEKLLNSERTKCQEETDRLNKNLADARKQISDLEDENMRLLDELESIKEKDATLYQSLREQLEEKNQEIARLNTGNKELLDRIGKSNESLEECERKRESSDNAMEELRNGLQNKEEARQALEDEKNALDQAFKSLKAQFESQQPSSSEDIEKLKEQKRLAEEFLNEENRKLQEKVRELENLESDREREHRERASKLDSELLNELKEVKSLYKFDKINSDNYLSQERLELLESMKECEKSRKESNQDYENKKNELESKQRERTSVNNELLDLEQSDEYKKAVSEGKVLLGKVFISQSESRHDELKNKVESLDEEIKTLNNQLRESRSYSVKKNSECSDLSQQYYSRGYLDRDEELSVENIEGRIKEYYYLKTIKEDGLKFVSEIERDLITVSEIVNKSLKVLGISGEKELNKILDQVETRKELREGVYDEIKDFKNKLQQLFMALFVLNGQLKPEKLKEDVLQYLDILSNQWRQNKNEKLGQLWNENAELLRELEDLIKKSQEIMKKLARIGENEILSESLNNEVLILKKQFESLDYANKMSNFYERLKDLKMRHSLLPLEEYESKEEAKSSQSPSLSEGDDLDRSQASQASQASWSSEHSQSSPQPSEMSEMSEMSDISNVSSPQPSEMSEMSEMSNVSSPEPSELEVKDPFKEVSKKLRNEKVLQASEEFKKYLSKMSKEDMLKNIISLEEEGNIEELESLLRKSIKDERNICLKTVNETKSKKPKSYRIELLNSCTELKNILEKILPSPLDKLQYPQSPQSPSLSNQNKEESTLSKRLRRFGQKDQDEERDNEKYASGSLAGSLKDMYGFKSKKNQDKSKRRLPRRKNY